nr:probable NAD(P)H dehydrogenase subunit CRR3, chloroplastic [Ipomoea batatas]
MSPLRLLSKNQPTNKYLPPISFAEEAGRVESGSDIGGEWPVEKKLREVGEWLLAATETSPDTSSRNILKTVFLWILPMWVLAFLVAARIIQLPFSSPFLDDLLL